MLYTTHLGPPTESLTYTYPIYLETNYKLVQVIDIMIQIKNSTEDTISQIDEITDKLDVSRDELYEFKNGTEVLNDNINSWLVDNHGWAKNS